MTINKNDVGKLINNLVTKHKENEWLEFKTNHIESEKIGETISALANGACIFNQPSAYLIFGIEDETHNIVGTKFKPLSAKKGNEPLESWLMQRLKPKIDFRIHELEYNQKLIAVFEIPAAVSEPIKFDHKSFIRIGSTIRHLNEFPEKERKIWNSKSRSDFELGIAVSHLSASDVVNLLDCQTYFELMNIQQPTTQEALLERLLKEKFVKQKSGEYQITNLGAILLAKDLNSFDTLFNKSLRIITYEGKGRIKTLKDHTVLKGYLVGFKDFITYINSQLPSSEKIGEALRQTVRVYPEIAIRELVANALIHQNFNENGSSPRVEIFDNRVEITNPGLPMIETERFVDEYKERNEVLANHMRRAGVCEGKGSGLDKVIFEIEFYQLPPPLIEIMEVHTKVTLFAPKQLREMDTNERNRACYQHACLRYVLKETMTNESLRERFNIKKSNYPTASKIIRSTIKAGLIKLQESENKAKQFLRYIPYWA